MEQINEIPKIIWMYWHQGEANAPYLVEQCIKSWKLRNPNWDIRVLDNQSILKWVNLEPFKSKLGMAIQMFSDLARLELLRVYGGVWADATLYCTRSLDEWLPNYIVDNFFVDQPP